MAGPDGATDRAAHAAAAGWTGRLLVALQFALLALLAVAALQGMAALASQAQGAGPGGNTGMDLRLWGRLLAAAGFIAAGAGLGLAAVAANRPGNFNIRPVPRVGGRLVQAGPYRRIRHPMYSALLLGGLGAALLAGAAPAPAVFAWMGLGALAGVLALKARVEERALRETHPGYAAYAAGTARFIPGVY